jgi:hypothetical protein
VRVKALGQEEIRLNQVDEVKRVACVRPQRVCADDRVSFHFYVIETAENRSIAWVVPKMVKMDNDFVTTMSKAMAECNKPSRNSAYIGSCAVVSDSDSQLTPALRLPWSLRSGQTV